MSQYLPRKAQEKEALKQEIRKPTLKSEHVAKPPNRAERRARGIR